MVSSYVPPDELLQFLAVLADGELAEEQERRLAEILRHDPQARTYYLDFVTLLTSLQWEYAAASGCAEPGEPAPPSRSRRRFRFLLTTAVGLASLAASLLLALPLFRSQPPPAAVSALEDVEPNDENVAMLVQATGVEWEETSPAVQPGASLPAGRLGLKAGMAQIQFYSGATVILEGPADLRLISPLEAYCARGKLRVTVPPQANGFTIGSPKLDLVDLGTEFGLRVDESAQTEVHVFQGKVELYDAGSGRTGSSRRELTTGRGLRVDESGTSQFIVPDPSAFHTAQQLALLAEQEARRRYQAWLAASERLHRDPRLLLHYTFQTDSPWDRTLLDQVQGRRESWRNGVIVGCEWASGRWPDKHALEFKRPGDRVRINIPGGYESVTLSAWVRIDSLEDSYYGLLMTDSWGDGHLHWQIRQDQTLSMSMLRGPGEHNQFVSPILGSGHFGQWTHLAAVYNRPVGTATHYVNGRAVSTHEILYPHTILFGSATIGNWGASQPGHPNRIHNLNSRMDEFLLFIRALKAKEIWDLYQTGKPSS